jgi:hypothetical protein
MSLLIVAGEGCDSLTLFCITIGVGALRSLSAADGQTRNSDPMCISGARKKAVLAREVSPLARLLVRKMSAPTDLRG